MGSIMTIARDLRLGFRSLRKRPLLLITSTLTLALGLGAAAAVFSVVEATLLRTMPFPEADRLAIVWGVAGPEQDIRGASPIEIQDWDRGVDALGPLARYNETTVNISGGGGEAAQLEAELVGVEYMDVLGVTPQQGRGFTAEDDLPGAPGTAVISHALWERRWGGAEDAIGRRVRLDDIDFRIIGVMPEGFHGLSLDTDVWVPLGPFVSPGFMTERGGRWLAAVGRLAPGATAPEAQRQLTAVAERLEREFPDVNRERSALLVPLRDFYVQQARPFLLIVLGGVGLLLLIACANVANLQLVRALERRREVALRYSLGAGRSAVARHLVAESLVLTIIGASAGVLVAWAALGALLPLVPDAVLPPYAEPRVNGLVVGVTVLFATVAGLAFALVPALRAATQAPAGALRGGGRHAAASPRRRGDPQQVIMVVATALALVLLVTAGLAVRSLATQLAIDPGFQPRDLLAARVSLTGDRYDGAGRLDYVETLVRQLEGLPGVEAAAAVSDAPLRGATSASYIFRAEDPIDADHRIRFYRHSVTPGAFATLGIPIVAGRGFTRADGPDDRPVVVVSQSFAAKVWPDQEPLGRRVVLGREDTATVVGVAGDVRQRVLTVDLMDPGEDPDVYFSYAQRPAGSFDVLVRAPDPGRFVGAVRDQVVAQDPNVPLYQVEAMETVLARATGLSRMASALLVVFSVIALVIAAIGLYGVLAFLVRGQRREIAIRSAIGARPREILGRVMGRGMLLVLIGLAFGSVGAVVVGRLASSLFFGVDGIDVSILAGTTLLLLGVAALASWLPARSAVRIEPRTVLAEE